MGDSMTVLVALVALCGVNLVLIWQVSTLADRVRSVLGATSSALGFRTSRHRVWKVRQ